MILGVLIIRKALNLHIKTRKKIKKIKPVALIGGFLDSVGGGGWGPIVTTTLIAGGRSFRYAVGSSHVAVLIMATKNLATCDEPTANFKSLPPAISVVVTIGPQPPPPTESKKPPAKANGGPRP